MKYELTNTTKTLPSGTVLHQIKALRDIGDFVKAGDLGGWIEKEANLSQEEDCWVFGNAEVSGNAQVSGYAQVSGNARVSGNAQVSGNARVCDSAQVSGYAQVSE